MLKRAILKLSGEALKDADTHEAFCAQTIDGIAGQIRETQKGGTQLALVVGGGNFWRGRAGGAAIDRVRADQIGMLATVMNALYLSEAFKAHGLQSVVMTPLPFGNMTTPFSKDAALGLMRQNIITIHAAGLGHPFFSTDTVTALRGLELEADCVLFTKNGVGGVYDKNPDAFPDARMFKTLSYKTAIGNELQFADAAALQLLSQAGTPGFVFGLDEPQSIVRACAHDPQRTSAGFGTLLHTNVKEEYYV